MISLYLLRGWRERKTEIVGDEANIRESERDLRRGGNRRCRRERGARETREKDTNSSAKGLSEMFSRRDGADVIFRGTRGSGVTCTGF